jgi:parvulin-like peptidyl-prolyl isomerase
MGLTAARTLRGRDKGGCVNRRLNVIIVLLVALPILVACNSTTQVSQPVPQSVSDPTALPAVTQPPAPTGASPAGTKPLVIATSAIPATPTSLAKGTPVKGALTCPATTPLPANAQLAARVNGQAISLDWFNRQAAQAQAAMIQNGLDPKSAAGQESLKSLKQQVLDQMISDVIIAQQAEYQGIKITDDDLNTQLAQMIQDAGSVEKLNDYLTKNQMTLGDLCQQMRANILSENMFKNVTALLPAVRDQVHLRQILVSTPALAQTLRDRARKGEDFAALAKQYSMDETSKANGGDLGWVPKGVLDPRIDAVAFDLPVNQVSDVITTSFGYHVVQVTEKEKGRALPPEILQDVRQQGFLLWLKAVRESVKIEQFVQP